MLMAYGNTVPHMSIIGWKRVNSSVMGYGCIKVHVFHRQYYVVEIDSLSCYSMSGMDLCFLVVSMLFV